MVADLHRVGSCEEGDRMLVRDTRVARYGNVIYDRTEPTRSASHAYLDELGIHCCGRYGEWNHAWTDDAFLSGEIAGERALEAAVH